MKGIYSKSIAAYFLFAASFISSCSNKKNAGEITIDGTIHSAKNGKVYLYGYLNDTAKYKRMKMLMDSAAISSAGRYFFSISENSNFLFDLRTKDSIIHSNLFLKPGDKLMLNFNKAADEPEIQGGSTCSKYNNYLLQYIDTFYSNPRSKHFYYVESNYLTLAGYHQFTDQRRQQELQFFHSYFKSYPPDSVFANFAISEINYQYGVDNFLFLWKRRMRGMRVIDDSTSYDFLKSMQIENPKALNSPAYFYFLHLYINDLYDQQIERGNLIMENQSDSTPALEKYHLAEKYLSGKFREIAQLNINESIGRK